MAVYTPICPFATLPARIDESCLLWLSRLKMTKACRCYRPLRDSMSSMSSMSKVSKVSKVQDEQGVSWG